MSRLYAVESLFTLTGASADHRCVFGEFGWRNCFGYFSDNIRFSSASSDGVDANGFLSV